MTEHQYPRRKIRSYVKRDGRMTDHQRRAFDECWPQFGLLLASGPINLTKVFHRKAPCILEIGFGSGQSLLSMAKANPECHFIGIETYQPGIGAVLLGMKRQKLSNIRLYHADAVEVIEQCIPEKSLDGVQIFFPDPWQKRRHHKRRLIQADFVNLLISRLKSGGLLHLATDWQDYAEHMLKVLTDIPVLINQMGEAQFAGRSTHRPVITKFEQRGLRSGRVIRELQFVLSKS